jgi:hypothetical protein
MSAEELFQFQFENPSMHLNPSASQRVVKRNPNKTQAM